MADDKNLARRSFAAVSWMLIFQFATNFLNLLVGFYLARTLDPEAYGVIGVLGLFWAISQVFYQGGFGAALLQRKEVTQVDLSTVFYYNMTISFVLALCMIGAAPWIADFFHRPILSKTICVSAWNMVFTAMAAVPRVILGRRLKQGVQTMMHLFALLISGTVAVVLANKGFGVWTFVWQITTSCVLSTIFICLYVRWVPSLTFSFKALWSLFGFGSNIMIVQLVNVLFRHVRKLVIGRFFPIVTLGYYEQTRRYATIWPESLENSLDHVLFPAFSKIQDDDARLRQAFKRALCVAVMVVLFPALMLATVSHPFIVLLLTERWLPCEDYWWLMTGVVMFYPLHELNVQLLKARGKSNLFMWLTLLKRGLAIGSLVLLYFEGIKAMLAFDIFASILCLFINTHYTAKDLHYGLFKQLRDVIVYPVLALVACACAWLTWHSMWELGWQFAIKDVTIDFSRWLGFFASLAVGGIVYLGLNFFLKTPAFFDALNIVAGKVTFLKRFVKKAEKTK